MAVTVRVAALFFRLTTPTPVFVALKLVTKFVLFNTVPVAELVVNRPPVIRPNPNSLMVPPAVTLTAPPVVTLPAFSVTSCPASRLTVPDPLSTSALRSMSLVPPVVVNVTVPAPAAVTPEPVTVSVPAFCTTTSPPVSLMPVTVSAPEFIRLTFPLVVFRALKLPTVFEPVRVVPVTVVDFSRPVVLNDPV